MFKWIVPCIVLVLLIAIYTTGTTDTRITVLCQPDDAGCTLVHNGDVLGRFDFDMTTGAGVQRFTARLQSRYADKASIEITGINYYMGYNHYPLRKQGDVFFYAGIMPNCIYREMHWQVRVLFAKGVTSYSADYSFFIRRDLDEIE